MKTVLVTGSAGFIGSHLVIRLLNDGYRVVGIDNVNDYYDVNLKYARLAEAGIYSSKETDCSGGKNRIYPTIEFYSQKRSIIHSNYSFFRANLEDKDFIMSLFRTWRFNYVVNLAAQAGVRYSIENPDVYVQSNVVGFLNILEACRQYPVEHLVFASSSSVYGNNTKVPFSTNDRTDNPVSLYAATKKTNELMAYTYSHLYQMPITGLRFFTVYGPWGRPDMAPMLFAKAIIDEEPIKVFNHGHLERDFTYIDDIVESTSRIMSVSVKTHLKYSVFNIGNGNPVKLLEFIETMEDAFDKKAVKYFLPMQPGDVNRTWADTQNLEDVIHYKPQIGLPEGIYHFSQWYKQFFGVSFVRCHSIA